MSEVTYESVDLSGEDLGDLSGFDMTDLADPGYTQQITRFVGEYKKGVWVSEWTDFDALFRGEHYEGRGRLVQPMKWVSFTEQKYDRADGTVGYNHGGTLLNWKMELEIKRSQGWTPLDVQLYGMAKEVAKAKGMTLSVEEYKVRRRAFANFERGLAFWFQQRGSDRNGAIRGRQLLTNPNPDFDYKPTGVGDQVTEEPWRKWGNIVSRYHVDLSTAMDVYGFHLGQDDPEWANPPGREVFHDFYDAMTKEFAFFLTRRLEIEALKELVEQQSGDDQKKTQARIEQLEGETRFFNAAGIDQIHEEDPDGKTYVNPAGQTRVLRVPVDRYRTASAPVGQLITQLGEVRLWNRKQRAVTSGVVTVPDEEPVTEDETDSDSKDAPTNTEPKPTKMPF